eukprot:2902890-Amphidinium_carterae.1
MAIISGSDLQDNVEFVGGISMDKARHWGKKNLGHAALANILRWLSACQLDSAAERPQVKHRIQRR